MIIDLTSIDFDGKSFHFDELSDELFGAFQDILGTSPFNIDIDVKPLGNTYQITGSMKSQYPEKCSRCGYDIDVPIKNKINEIVVIEKKRPRNTQVSQSQQNFDGEGPQVTYINEPSLDLAEFLHEIMASSFQIYPQCEDQEKCERQRFQVQQNDEPLKTQGHPGFAALKDFKSKH